MKFELLETAKSSSARAGILKTDHGNIHTPIFMPVGTVGSVKTVHFHELDEEIGAEIILGNTYHLYLRPGEKVLKTAGGYQEFTSWRKPVLTDSGGYQVYSLADNRKITEEGVKFKSHIDGSSHMFSPERSMEIQRAIGGNIIMAFDECPPYPCNFEYARKSMEMTHRWLQRCYDYLKENKEFYNYKQTLFPILQGGPFDDLRAKSAEFVSQFDGCGIAIGGLSVGEPHEMMYHITKNVCEILPKDKARYLMGVGTPANILECISLGVDMFDCVMPTRNARNGQLFTAEGIINIKNKKWEFDFSPIDEAGYTYVDKRHCKAYLRHLFHAGERLGPQIASIHNLGFYLWLVKEARRRIIDGSFDAWKIEMIEKVSRRI